MLFVRPGSDMHRTHTTRRFVRIVNDAAKLRLFVALTNPKVNAK